MVDQWIEDRLASINTTLETISTGLSERIYLEVAPQGTKWPCIIYQCQDTPREVRGVGTFAVMVDTLYLVKAVAQVSSYAPLVPIAKAIHDVLTSATGNAVGDGEVLTSARDRQFSMIEATNGSEYRHLGGQYRIFAQG